MLLQAQPVALFMWLCTLSPQSGDNAGLMMVPAPWVGVGGNIELHVNKTLNFLTEAWDFF